MQKKVLYVSSAVQKALLERVFIQELKTGFWRDFRPVGHGEVWNDVEIIVSDTNQLGPVGWTPARTYNFLNLDFCNPNESILVEVARAVKPSSTYRSIKKELIELGQIVAGRLTSKVDTPIKFYRGNHRPGEVTVSTAACRAAGKSLQAAAAEATQQAKETADAVKVERPRSGVKRTVTKSPTGATVTRVTIR